MDTLTIHHDADPTAPHHARDPHVEREWLPLLGPSSLVLLRRLALDHATGGPTSTYDRAELAAAVGIGLPALTRVLARLVQFRLAERHDDGSYTVAATLHDPPRRRARKAAA